jgi:hypothetical protein
MHVFNLGKTRFFGNEFKLNGQWRVMENENVERIIM